jgi:hypothetical protein
MAFLLYALGFCMANGKGPILNLQGTVDANHALVVVSQAVSGTPSGGNPIANLQGMVDASHRLVVTFG